LILTLTFEGGTLRSPHGGDLCPLINYRQKPMDNKRSQSTKGVLDPYLRHNASSESITLVYSR